MGRAEAYIYCQEIMAVKIEIIEAVTSGYVRET